MDETIKFERAQMQNNENSKVVKNNSQNQCHIARKAASCRT